MLRRLDVEAPASQMLSVLNQDGGLVVEGLFPQTTIRQMTEAIDEASASFRPGGATQGMGLDGKSFAGGNTIRFSGLGKLSPAFFDMLDNAVFKTLADAALLPNCGSYWVNSGQAMLIGPGSKSQGLHRDCMNWSQYCAPLWPHCPEVTLSAMIALDDVSEELGATRVIPGSQNWEAYGDAWDVSQTVPAEMKVGDALIYSGKLVHGGGAT